MLLSYCKAFRMPLPTFNNNIKWHYLHNGDDDARERIIFADAITVYFCRRGGEVSWWCAYHPVHCGAWRRPPTIPYHPQLCSITPYHAEPYGSTQATTPYHMISHHLVLICHYTLLQYSMIPFHGKPHQNVPYCTIPSYPR